MGADGVAITFVTPDQGELLTSVEALINHQLEADAIDGFEAFEPRLPAEPQPPKPVVPVFGRRSRRYTRRL
jgi:ATP-dependent RNA helicase DeaD